MARLNKNSTEALSTAVAKNATTKLALEPPKGFTALQLELWRAVLDTRTAEEWRKADLPLLKAYVKAWSDIEDIQKRIDDGDYVHGGQVNPLLKALNYRLSHMSMVFLRLGLQLNVPKNSTDQASQTKHRNAMRTARDSLGDDDGLLAHPE